MFQNSCHVFNFDCRLTHVSHIWSDRKFNGELNRSCYKVIPSSYQPFYDGM